ncbi:uncharacterized protein LOC107270605 isoform X2 [Cephus cinctus]|uniref:Uncharacterized protein LOC107270605 isoform X2 n=1 Tax=Cephus cinctus TaxID=211228 RepID=A0AAJ7FP10_CEPCN|nr:uncharacterized protein LOC107270605 isoform X2 [Cephus cinctus]
MNEVKQVWTSLRSPRTSTTLINNTNSNTTWYDVPAPVIIHNRDFCEDTSAIGTSSERNKVETTPCELSRMDEVSKKHNMQQNKMVQDEVLYQNNVEAALNSLSKICVEPLKAEMDLDMSTDNSEKEASPGLNSETEESNQRRRHSSSVEIAATSSLTIGEDGMPSISFSFLQTEDSTKVIEAKDKVVKDEEKEKVEAGIQDQLYDFPKSPTVEAINVTGSSADTKRRKDDDNIDEKNTIEDDLYDVPKSAKETNDSVTKDSETIESFKEDDLNLPSSERKNDSKRSSRSLKSSRSMRVAESDMTETLGIASGSYSDPECPEGLSSRHSKRLKRQKRRLGKAWGKMRSWLRDEKSRFGEVVARHARLQAVGALQSDQEEYTRGQCGSYDLTKERSLNLGSITRVEEFGLSSVSEEGNVSDTERPSSSFEHSGKSSELNKEDVEKIEHGNGNLRKKTVSSENILGSAKIKFAPVSFSMDKLCSDGENEDARQEAEGETRDAAGKGGLIKRRMLGSIRGLMASTHLIQPHEIEEGGQGGFEEVRRYVKQGGDFCKELAAILHERAELEATYAKGLSKLSGKLTKACSKDQGGNSAGGVNEAWRCVGEEMEAAAEAHRVLGVALGEQLAKPLRVGVAEAQGRSRKVIENSVDKASKSLQEWRSIAAKSKKQSFACARENERLQDLARIQSISQGQQNNNKSSNHHMTEKEANKLETRRRKAEDSSRRADTEFYTISVRAERARLEYESTVRKGAKQMELLEEERLSALKDLANVYLAHLQALAPRLQQSADRLSTPVRNCNVSQDVEILKNLIRRLDNNDSSNAEQLLPDFYAEHVTLAMNRERRKQALVRVLHLIRQDLERERRGREGLETLHRAFIKTPAFAADESTQNVTDKLHHMRSMLTYLEAARYKVGGTLAEIEGSQRGKHPLAEHILVSRDKQGLQQSVLKVPSWAKNESFETQEGQDELDVHLTKDRENVNRDWVDRTAGDGNSENPPEEEDFSDFDEFSSHSEDNNNQEIDTSEISTKNDTSEQCRAMYQYSANLNDELSLNPGDLITIHEKQADGWWIGECRGRTGIFPATYVQVIH